MRERVVIIGAGHHGLVAAIRLAARGQEVLVVERAGAPGGGVSSAELTLPGFVHDHCAAFFPLAAASPAFRELPLERHGLEWIDPPLAMAHVFDGGQAIGLHRDLGATVESLERCAPGAGAAWRELIETLWPQREALVRAGLGRFPPLRAGTRVLAGLRSHAIDLAQLALSSAATMGRRLFADDRAAAWLAGAGAHADISPYALPSGVFSLGLHFLGHHVGWPLPRGGAGKLTGALVSHLRELGGELRCGAPVERIEVSSGRVTGVVLNGGERLDARALICTVSPGPLMTMLGDSALPGRVSRRLRRWRYGLGTVKLDWALSGPVPWEAEDARTAAVVHVGGPIGELGQAFQDSTSGRFPERPLLVVGQQSLHDPSRAPEGRHTLYAYARVPQRPGIGGDEMAERVTRRLERFAPGFSDLVLERSLLTPADIERDNPSMGGGDLAGGSCELDQQLLFRPAPELFRYRTPVSGLYVAGAWVHPGAGVHGMAGRGAADVLLADLARPGRRRRSRPPVPPQW
jgi:phytoene dehydrogenase-like protein